MAVWSALLSAACLIQEALGCSFGGKVQPLSYGPVMWRIPWLSSIFWESTCHGGEDSPVTETRKQESIRRGKGSRSGRGSSTWGDSGNDIHGSMPANRSGCPGARTSQSYFQ
ncbi:hypothetical protein DFS33DRAFT_1356026 [Desarmillaria ectypa]|nr:hypothetical protein DFS33DRAFT_1356026 [Desarmillaria ectypa]